VSSFFEQLVGYGHAVLKFVGGIDSFVLIWLCTHFSYVYVYATEYFFNKLNAEFVLVKWVDDFCH